MTQTILYQTPHGEFEVAVDDHISRDAFVVRPSGTFPGWSPNVNGYLLRLFDEKRIGTYVDVGAHVGMTTIQLGIASPGLPIFCFEPIPFNRGLLFRNLLRNKVHATVREEAVSDRVGRREIAAAIYNFHDHRIVNPSTPLVDGGMNDTKHRDRLEVETTTLDAFFEGREIARPLVVKIDVQGHDAAVLRGALRVRPDTVILEYWPFGLVEAGEVWASVEPLLSRYRQGAILVEPNMKLTEGGHVQVARQIPWDGKVQTAIDLVMEGPR